MKPGQRCPASVDLSSLYRDRTLGSVTCRTYETHRTQEFAESGNLSRFEDLQSVRVLLAEPFDSSLPPQGRDVYYWGWDSLRARSPVFIGRDESKGPERANSSERAEGPRNREFHIRTSRLAPPNRRWGDFVLVGTSYGSLISLPVRHPFDSHPTLPYIALVLLIPRAVGIIHARVGFP